MAAKRETHLTMIQGIINRLSQNSFLLKGWSVVLVSALLAIAANSSKDDLIFVAFLPAVAFWGLDGYFLWQERLFRALYDHARGLDEAHVDYGLNTKEFRPGSTFWREFRGHRRSDRPRRITWPRATFSRTLLAFHGAVLATVAILAAVALSTSLWD